MPVTRVTDTNDTSEAPQEAVAAIRTALIAHAGSTRWLRAQRKRTKKSRPPALATRIAFNPDPAEDLDGLATEAAEAILDVITTDAGGEQWNGDVDLLGDDTRFGNPRIIATVDVSIEGDIIPSPATAKARAEADSMAAQSKTIEGLGAALVKIANAKASDAEAMSKMVASLSEMHRSDRKWDYKIEKEKQQTERDEIDERARTTRAKQRWDVFETLLEEYKDVATIWSQWLTTVRKDGEGLMPGKPPTEAELASVFADGKFEQPVVLVEDGKPVTHNLRGVIAEMLAESDRKRRIMIAKRLKSVLNALDKSVQDDLRATFLRVCGPERAIEIALWLSLPIVG